jgi:hypothetical protein
VIVWDLTSGTQIVKLDGHNAGVRSVAYDPIGRFAASGAVNGAIFLWDMDENSATFGQVLRVFDGHSRAVFGLSFSPDGSALASGSLDGTLRLWDVGTGFEVRRYTITDGATFRSVAFNQDGRVVLTGMTDGSLREWRILTVLEELIAWTFANRFVPEPTCADRALFNLLPLCEGNVPPPTRTPYPLPTPTATPEPMLYSGQLARVNTDNNDNLRVRAQPDPSTEANILERLPNDAVVLLLEGPVQASGFTWWRVRTESGVEGWAVESVPADSLQTLVPAD